METRCRDRLNPYRKIPSSSSWHPLSCQKSLEFITKVMCENEKISAFFSSFLRRFCPSGTRFSAHQVTLQSSSQQGLQLPDSLVPCVPLSFVHAASSWRGTLAAGYKEVREVLI